MTLGYPLLTVLGVLLVWMLVRAGMVRLLRRTR
jgi:hypothetical protein